MAKLILSMNGAIQGEYQLDRERFRIGRKAENDCQVDNLAVSGKHAIIITILDDSFLEDLGSTNGTYVNGKLVKKYALKDGDIISIGKHELKYINEHAAEDDDFEKTMIIRPNSASAAASAAKTAEKVGAISATSVQAGLPGAKPPLGMPLGRLTVLSGPIAGKELALTKALITLGKPGTQVAVISRRPQGYFMTHIESISGFPVINGSQIGNNAHLLRNGDIIELAGIKMEFALSG